MFSGWNASDTIKLVGLIGGLIAFLFGYYEFWKSQKWKRAEWVATEVTDFLNDPMVRAALTMIDWGGKPVLLFPEKTDPNERYFQTSDEIISRALEHHSLHGPYNPAEAAIRDCFDRLLDRFERFNHFIESNLISEFDIKPYFHYWFERVGNVEIKSSGVGFKRIRQIHQYIHDYGFHGVSGLFKRFGYQLSEYNTSTTTNTINSKVEMS
jgi:hypothetical protein